MRVCHGSGCAYGNKALVIAASVSAEAWGGETAAGSGTITLPLRGLLYLRTIWDGKIRGP